MAKSRLAILARVLALLALASGPGAAQTLLSDTELRAILQQRVDSKRSVGIVVGLLDSAGRRVVACGSSGSERPLDGDTVFEIGSMTKVFTAALLAEMVRRGEVRLEDPVSKYLPETVRVPLRNGKQITLLLLATQTSGLPRLPGNMAPRDPKNPYVDYSVEQMYDFLSHYELPRDPGEKYEYSNLGMGLLGHALSLRAGTSYEELVGKRILEPLGMRDSGITLTPGMRERLALGHDASGAEVQSWHGTTLAGAGALRSTVNDMLKFLAANLTGSKGPVPSALADTHQVRHATDLPLLDVGLGWHIIHRFDVDIVWHNGGTGGYHSWMGFIQRKRAATVVLSDSTPDIDDIGLHILEPRYPIR